MIAVSQSWNNNTGSDGLYLGIQHQVTAAITNQYQLTSATTSGGNGGVTVTRLLNITATNEWIRIRFTANDANYTLLGTVPTKGTETSYLLTYSAFQGWLHK
jgi:hypothetical protein